MFCIKCGAKLIEEAKFCPKCGNAVAASTTTSAKVSQDSPAGQASVTSREQHTMEEPHILPAVQQDGDPKRAAKSERESQAPSPGQSKAAPPAWNQGAGIPQSPPISQANSVPHGNPQAGSMPTTGQPGNTSPVHPQKAGIPQAPSPGYPGAPIIPPKKKTARWPWVVCGLGVAAIAFVIVAILGSALGQPSEPIEPSSSQVQEVSLTETFTNEEEGFSFQYPSAWEPVAQEDMDNYADLAETESTLVLLANEYEDIPEANSYIKVSRYDTDEGDEELLALDDEAFFGGDPD